ncbi:MAG: DUF4097 family beta strand repeat protein [Clostridia bacterium]|nr:DUF4097 family beta strand repeat protein [Clostridia bacterium]
MKKNQWLGIVVIVCAVVLLAAGLQKLPFARAEQYRVGDAEITDTVRNLIVNWTSGAVHIAYHEGNAILISEHTEGALSEDRRMHWRLAGDTLEIEYDRPGFRLFSFLPHRKELTVVLPNALLLNQADISATSATLDIPALRADSLRLETTSGSIRAGVDARVVEGKLTSGSVALQVSDRAETVRIKATSGDIALRAEQVSDQCKLDTTSGTVRAAVKRAGSFQAHSTSGGISAAIGEAKQASMEATSGTVAVEVAAVAALEIQTTSGNVTAALPTATGFTAQIETTSGRVVHQLPLTQQGKTYVYGDGSAAVKIRTTSGNVTIDGVN